MMKKLLLISLLSIGLAMPALADNNNNQATQNQVPTVTIMEAMQLPDDAKVIIVGTVSKAMGDEKYMIKDNSGEMIVEIDDDDWIGVAATAGNTVEIHGEVDRDGNETIEIDVDQAVVKQ